MTTNDGNNNYNGTNSQSPSSGSNPNSSTTSGEETTGAKAQDPGSNPGYPQQYGQQQYQGYNSNVQTQEIPPEIKKWNWGAFAYNWVWGIGNHAYLSLICLVPCVGFIWMFVTGALGNQWAWQSGEFRSVEEFLAVQKTWNRAGIVTIIVSVAILILYIIFASVLIGAIIPYIDQIAYDPILPV